MKLLITLIFSTVVFPIHNSIYVSERQKLDCSFKELKHLTKKPVVILLFDNFDLSDLKEESLELRKHEKLLFNVDFVTVEVPRECYYFEKVEMTLSRNKRTLIHEILNNIDYVDLGKIKKMYEPGDVLTICPFPKLKNGIIINFCPEIKSIKLK